MDGFLTCTSYKADPNSFSGGAQEIKNKFNFYLEVNLNQSNGIGMSITQGKRTEFVLKSQEMSLKKNINGTQID